MSISGGKAPPVKAPVHKIAGFKFKDSGDKKGEVDAKDLIYLPGKKDPVTAAKFQSLFGHRVIGMSYKRLRERAKDILPSAKIVGSFQKEPHSMEALEKRASVMKIGPQDVSFHKTLILDGQKLTAVDKGYKIEEGDKGAVAFLAKKGYMIIRVGMVPRQKMGYLAVKPNDMRASLIKSGASPALASKIMKQMKTRSAGILHMFGIK